MNGTLGRARSLALEDIGVEPVAPPDWFGDSLLFLIALLLGFAVMATVTLNTFDRLINGYVPEEWRESALLLAPRVALFGLAVVAIVVAKVTASTPPDFLTGLFQLLFVVAAIGGVILGGILWWNWFRAERRWY